MNTHEKYLVYHNVNKKHNIKLSEEQIETIDLIYNNREAENKGSLVFYRLINFILSCAVFILFLFVRKDEFSYWFSIGLAALFGFVNFFYMFLNVYRLVKFKKLKGLKSE